MAIYEYLCERCGLKFEQYRGFWQSDNEIECPACGQAAPARQFSSFSSSNTSSCGSSNSSFG
jgi:putative FmdB family regulatory protein